MPLGGHRGAAHLWDTEG